MKNRESESANTGAIRLRPLAGSVGCALIDHMRRATPKGCAKPWRTADNIEFVERVAGAGVTQGELEAYISGCAELVEARGEAPIYWTVRQLFTSPTMDWWRGKVAAQAHAAELRDAHELDEAARAERERLEREHRREQARQAPASLDMRRAAGPLKEAVVARARVQELASATLAGLRGQGQASGSPSPCPKCEAVVSAGEAKCPACHATLIDQRGHKRVGLRRA